MSCIPDVQTTQAMYSLYQQGNSLAQVAEMFRVTRQSVYERLHRRGMHLRHRIMPNPFIEFDGHRYFRVVSGHYAGYYRKSVGDREMLHRAIWRKHNGPIPPDHEVIYLDGNKTNIDPENLACLPRDEATTMIQARLHPIVMKRCLACDEPMGRRFSWNHREGPAAYKKRKTCNPACSADWKRNRPRGSRMPT